MSATIESDKIAAYFGGCPVLSVPGRTFPVTSLYLEDAIETTQYQISKDSPFARSLSLKQLPFALILTPARQTLKAQGFARISHIDALWK